MKIGQIGPKIGQKIGQSAGALNSVLKPPSNSPVCDIIKFRLKLLELGIQVRRTDGRRVIQYPPSATKDGGQK